MHSFLSSSSSDRPVSAGCRPSSSLTFFSCATGSLSVGRRLAYSGSLNGTTVFSPSLPPVSSTTTRMVSLPPFFDGPAAASAVRRTNSGMLAPQATTPEACRKSRRVNMEASSCRERPPRRSSSSRNATEGVPYRSIQLELRQRQHQVAQRADTLVGGVLLGPVHGHLLGLRLLLIIEQPLARLVGH